MKICGGFLFVIEFFLIFARIFANSRFMAEDFTIRPNQADSGLQTRQFDEFVPDIGSKHRQESQMMSMQQAYGVACPSCGAVNESEALFCASCGKPLRMGVCPKCGSEIEADADFCEICHHYIKSDVCSFCGAHLSVGEMYCHECGSPVGGIVCPVCNTLNDFAFCKQCGTPLTEEAKALAEEMKHHPDYQLLQDTAKELEELSVQIPYKTERDVVRDQMNDKLRERVLTLLAQDKGVPNPIIPPKQNKRLSQEELKKMKEERSRTLTEILDRMAVPAQPSAVKVRNYAMAQKPIGVKLAWVCNWKHAMHSSPCGCAKPQLGGKWVILGKKNNEEIKDDK